MAKVFALFVPLALLGLIGGFLWAYPVADWALPKAGGHGAWYASRASGIASYLCLWVGLAGGLAMSSAWFDGIVNRARLLAIHQTASITGVVVGVAHALVLIPDGWTRFGLVDVLVPFGSYYQRLDTAVGSLSLYLTAVVSGSFWLRRKMGMRSWRLLHYSSFAAYGGALWHGIRVGTDSNEAWLMGLYLVTGLTVVFALGVRITYVREQRRPQPTNGASIA